MFVIDRSPEVGRAISSYRSNGRRPCSHAVSPTSPIVGTQCPEIPQGLPPKRHAAPCRLSGKPEILRVFCKASLGKAVTQAGSDHFFRR